MHRDLKPGNIIMAADGPRIIDFGIARPVGASTLTERDTLVGTYSFMSPEQFRGDPATPSSDVFALGCVLAFALWNVATRSVTGLIANPGVTNWLIFTRDGRTLITGAETGAVVLWNVATRKQVATARAGSTNGSAAPEDAAALSPDGKTLAFAAGVGSTANPDVVDLWSMTTHQVTWKVAAASGGTSALAFSPGGTQLAGSSDDGTVRLWNVRASGKPLLLETFAGHRESAVDVAFSPDGGTLASASFDGSIDLWSTQGTLLGGVANSAIAAVFSPDGRTLAISTDTPDGSHAAILLYSMPARKLAAVLPVTGIAALAYSPDGKMLAVAPVNSPGDKVLLWNTATHAVTATITTGLTTRINSIAFSPDGTLLAVAGIQDTKMQVWSVAGLTRVASFDATLNTDYPPALGGGVTMLTFSPDGRLLALVGIDGIVRLYSVPGFSLAGWLQPPIGSTALAFSPSGRELALGNGNGSVFLYRVPATNAALARWDNGDTYLGSFAASTKEIFTLRFLSSDELVAAGVDQVVRFWTVPSRVPSDGFSATIPAQTLATHDGGAISDVSYSAPLGLLVTTSPSGTRVWQVSPPTIATAICRALQGPGAAVPVVGLHSWPPLPGGVRMTPARPRPWECRWP